MAMPDNPLMLNALYPQTRTQERKAREQGLNDREGLINFLSFLARPAKGLALMAGAIEPEQHPDYKIPFDPKYSYPYGTPKSKVASEEAMKFAESVGFGTGNVGGMVGSTWLAQLAKKGYKGEEAKKLLADKWGSTTKAYYPEVKPQVQAWVDSLPGKLPSEGMSKEQAIINLLNKKGFKDVEHLGKGAALAKNADDLWYSLPHEIKSKHVSEAIKALDPASPQFTEFELAKKVLQKGERFPLIEKAIEISKSVPPSKPAAAPSSSFNPNMLQQPWAPGETKEEVIKNLIEGANLQAHKVPFATPQQAKALATAKNIEDLWGSSPAAMTHEHFSKAAEKIGSPWKPGENIPLFKGERLPMLDEAAKLAGGQGVKAQEGKKTLTYPSIRRADAPPPEAAGEIVNKADNLLDLGRAIEALRGPTLKSNIYDLARKKFVDERGMRPEIFDDLMSLPLLGRQVGPTLPMGPKGSGLHDDRLKKFYPAAEELDTLRMEPGKPLSLSVRSGAHVLSEPRARAANFNIPVFKGMSYFDAAKNELSMNSYHKSPAQFLTASPRVADEYTSRGAGNAPVILPLWLKSLNPYYYGSKTHATSWDEIDFGGVIQRAKDRGHDSVVFLNTSDLGGISHQYTAFNPNQLRSVHARFKELESGNLMGARLVPPPPQEQNREEK